MGYMDSGSWVIGDATPDTKSFVRKPSTFRSCVVSGSNFEPASGRYRLFASLTCPWACRTLIVRSLKGLENAIPITLVHSDPDMGWTVDDGESDLPEEIRHIYELYRMADPVFSGRVTVPVLWDTKNRTIVNNESAEIIVMLNRAFNQWGDSSVDLYPEQLIPEIDRINDLVYDGLNNAVYRAGFSTDQAAYEEAVVKVFETMDFLEDRLKSSRYLVGDQLTLADVRLFTTGIRFDLVYFGHFKCNLRQWCSYPNLWAWLRDLYQDRKIMDTVNFDVMKRGYYTAHKRINPSGIVPLGPKLDFLSPHSREKLAQEVRAT